MNGVESKQFDHFGPCSPYFDSKETRACFSEKHGLIFSYFTPWSGPSRSKPTKYLIFSPDSSRLAFFSRRDYEFKITVDGREGKSFDSIDFSTFRFSQDSKHYYYRANKANREYLVVNGKEHQLYADSSILGVLISPDGQRFAYFYKDNKDKSGAYIVIDGTRHRYDDAGALSYPANGRSTYTSWDPGFRNGRLTYIAKRGGQWFIVSDGREGKPYDDIESVKFSPSGDHYAFVARFDQKQMVVLDEVEGAVREEIGKQLLFSPKEEHLVYSARIGEKWAIVIDEVEGERYDSVRDFVFSPDGQYIAYVASAGKKEFVVIEDVKRRQKVSTHGTYDSIHSVVFIPGSRDVSFWAFRRVDDGGDYFLVVGEKEYRTEISGLEPVVFSPDGKRFGFVSDRRRINIDGKDSDQYWEICGKGPVFSFDGSHFAFVAKIGLEKGYKWRQSCPI